MNWSLKILNYLRIVTEENSVDLFERKCNNIEMEKMWFLNTEATSLISARLLALRVKL